MKLFKIVILLFLFQSTFYSCFSSTKKVDLIKKSFEIIQNDPNFMKHWIAQNEQLIVHSEESDFMLDKIKGYHPTNYDRFIKLDFTSTDINNISKSISVNGKRIDEKSAYEKMNENSENIVFYFYSDIYCLGDTCIVACGVMKNKRSGIPVTFRYLVKNKELKLMNFDQVVI